MSRLTGQVALVTGGGRGIGRAAALALAKEGMKVAACSRTLADVEEVASLIRADGGASLAVHCDVADADQVAAAVTATEQALGPIDLLVNNAGVGTVRPTEVADYDLAEWDRIVNVNLRGRSCAVARSCAGCANVDAGRSSTSGRSPGTSQCLSLRRTA